MGLLETLRAVETTNRICAPTVIDSMLGRVEMSVCDDRLDWWAKRLLEVAEVTLEVEGREHAPHGEAFVVMSNHRSYYDIPSVFCAVPGPLRMVAKKELFRVPIFGGAMLASGFVRIDRGDRGKAIESLQQSRALIERGTRVWIAPEGTRTRTGKLGTFKSGGFRLALDAGVRILPVALDGTQNVLPHDGYLVRKGAKVRVQLLPPIDAPSYGVEGRRRLMKDVRKAIARALGEEADDEARAES